MVKMVRRLNLLTRYKVGEGILTFLWNIRFITDKFSGGEKLNTISASTITNGKAIGHYRAYFRTGRIERN